jgi:hypothetical protein
MRRDAKFVLDKPRVALVCLLAASKNKFLKKLRGSLTAVEFIRFFRALYLYCTRPDLRKKAAAKMKAKERAYRARAQYNRKYRDEDDHSVFDSNPMIIGSSAWIIDQSLVSAFDSKASQHSFDHDSFRSSLHAFDATPSLFDSSFSSSTNPFDISNPMSDWVTGGTDSTGMHGAGGHHDQFPSSSNNPFA